MDDRYKPDWTSRSQIRRDDFGSDELSDDLSDDGSEDVNRGDGRELRSPTAAATQPSNASRLIAGFGEAPWWAHLALTIAVAFSLGAAVAAQVLLLANAAWTLLLATLGLGLTTSGGSQRFERFSRTTLPHQLPKRLLIGYIGVLGAGAAPYLYWAWSDRSSARPGSVPLVVAMAAAIGLLLATRSGLVVAVVSGLMLTVLSSGAGGSRWWTGSALLSMLCALAVLGRMSIEAPGPSTRRIDSRRLRGLMRPSTVFVALVSVLIGLLLDHPLSSLLNRAKNISFAQQSGGSGGPFRSGNPSRNQLDSVFRPGGSNDAQGTLQFAESFSIDKFGALDATPVLKATFRGQGSGPGTTRSVLLRGEAFDQWDGKTWTADRNGRTRSSLNVLIDQVEDPSFEQILTSANVELLNGSTDLVFGESRVASVDVGVDTLRVSVDETIRTSSVMGAGTRYVVISARHPWRDAGPPTPRESLLPGVDAFSQFGVRAEHLDVSGVSPRTKALALQLGNSSDSIEGVETNIEGWLATNTGYDFTARQKTSPNDVVDDFLFLSRRGWCEQVASATVMLLRANGIPARLVTGYLPSVLNSDGSQTALSRDAHAWVEMYLPGRGWAPRDPTAVVPLIQGPPKVSSRRLPFDARVVAALVAVLVGVTMLVTLLRRRRARRRVTWMQRQTGVLEHLGEARGAGRAREQTLTEFGLKLRNTAIPDERLSSVIAVLERERFGPDIARTTEQERAWVEKTLAELELQFPRPKKRWRRRSARQHER
jgi:transglutaminase-like putative cysteine protease